MNLTFYAVLALVGGTIHTADGPAIKGGVVLVEAGQIVAVGKDIPIPKDAQRVDVSGRVITPGFIDGWTQLGLVEIWGVARTNDTNAGRGEIQAAQRPEDSFNPHSSVIAIQRAHGVTSVHVTLSGGLISGQGGVWDLGVSQPVRSPVGLLASLGGVGQGSRGARLARLREVFDDALAYGQNRKRFEDNRYRRVAASRLDLEAILPVVRGQLPLFVRVDRRADINALLRWSQRSKIKLVLVGAREAWLEAERIARAKVGVILDPSANEPSNFDMLRSREDAAVILHRAGVKFAISTFSTHNVRKLRQWAGNAVRAGLPHWAALKAVTGGAADLLGLSKRGRIAPGQVANLVVWSGDPFEFESTINHLFVRGEAVDMSHRQRALFRRYRHLGTPLQ